LRRRSGGQRIELLQSDEPPALQFGDQVALFDGAVTDGADQPSREVVQHRLDGREHAGNGTRAVQEPNSVRSSARVPTYRLYAHVRRRRPSRVERRQPIPFPGDEVLGTHRSARAQVAADLWDISRELVDGALHR